MNRPALFSLLFLLSLPTAARPETVAFPEPNWTREAAVAALRRSDTRASLAGLFTLARQGDSQGLLVELGRIEAANGLSDPARDGLLHAFATGLGDLPPGSVNRDVWERLQSYRPRALVPDEHHPAVGVPLFNVRAAAAGSLNEWRRLMAWSEGERLLLRDDQAWIAAWKSADPARRRGLEGSLQGASPHRLSLLGGTALVMAANEPDLAAVAARAALLAQDAELFRDAVSHSAPGLSAVLRAAPEAFGPQATVEILRQVMQSAPPASGALAMAHLAPPLLDEPDVAALMIGSLGHRELGGAAALVLSGSEDPHVRAELARLAQEGSALEKQRAGLTAQLAAQRAEEDPR